jgi:F5/8 type C domain
MQIKKIIKTVSATVLGLASITLASGCSTATDEDLASVDEAFTAVNGGVCSTPTQIAAEIVRTAMVDLGRYRPGLDLVKGQNGQVILTAGGLSRCSTRGGCPRLKSLLSYQGLNNMQVEALSSEFPFMKNLQTGGIANAIASSMSDELNPNPNQVISHSLTFAHTHSAPPMANCGINLTYHCFSVSGLPSGKTATDLADNLNSLLSSNNEVHALTRIFVDSSNHLCIDPDGTGDDQTGGGSTGGSTCVDGTMAIMFDPSFVGNCCTTAAGTGFLSQNVTDPNYMSCKINDLAAGKAASTDSTASGYPASNVTDADLATLWKAADANANHWAKVDFGSAISIKGVVFKFEAAGAYGYKVETSSTGSIWAVKKTGTSAANATSQDVSFAAASARYVRVTLTSMPSGKSGALASVRVY